MVKKVLLIAVVLLAGCHQVERTPVLPGAKIDRDSQLYHELAWRVYVAWRLKMDEERYGVSDK